MELSNRWVLILPTNMLNYGFCMANDENLHIHWKPFYFWWSWLIKVANCITSQLYGMCWMSTLISCSSWGALMSTSIWQAWLIWLCDKLTKRYQMICWSMDISKNSGGSFSRVIRFISSWSLQFYKSKMIILFFLRWWLIEFRDGGESSRGSSTTGYRDSPDSCGGRLPSCLKLSFLMSDIDIREQEHQIWGCSTEILLHVCIEAECPIRWVLDWLLETSAGAFFASQIGLRQLLLLKISPVLHHSIFDLIIFISTFRGKCHILQLLMFFVSYSFCFNRFIFLFTLLGLLLSRFIIILEQWSRLLVLDGFEVVGRCYLLSVFEEFIFFHHVEPRKRDQHTDTRQCDEQPESAVVVLVYAQYSEEECSPLSSHNGPYKNLHV